MSAGYAGSVAIQPGESNEDRPRDESGGPLARSKRLPCENVAIIGARGSGEKHSKRWGWFGSRAGAFQKALVKKLKGRRTAASHALPKTDYVAHAVWMLARPPFSPQNRFFKGIRQGVDSTVALLRSQAIVCPAQVFVLTGYSQGAMVMHRAMARLAKSGSLSDTSILDRIAGAVLIADGDRVRSSRVAHLVGSPAAGKRGRGIANVVGKQPDVPGGGVQGRTWSVCTKNDIVCDNRASKADLLNVIAGLRRNAFLAIEGTRVHLGGDYRSKSPLLATAAERIKNTLLLFPQPDPRYGRIEATVGEPLSIQLAVDVRRTAAVDRLTWAAPESLPDGITLSPTGLLEGTPTTPGKITSTYSVSLGTTGIFALPQPGEIAWTVRTEDDPDPDDGLVSRVSVAADGTESRGESWNRAVSADGRFVAYSSAASNLVTGDTNGAPDVFVRDRDTETTSRVSISSDGTQANGGAGDRDGSVAISADGRFVAYSSAASNLVKGDTNDDQDVFVWDRTTRTTSRVSVASDGTQSDGYSAHPSMSSDGRFVAYWSTATNLVPGDDTQGLGDVFLWDRATGLTSRVSVPRSGTENDNGSVDPVISGDGRYVAFNSGSSHLVAGDTNNEWDVFVWARESRVISLASVSTDGTQGNFTSGVHGGLAISADGRYVAYPSGATNLVSDDTNGRQDVFLRDQLTLTTSLVSVASDGAQASGDSFAPAISADGSYIAYASTAPDLVPGDTNNSLDVFLFDRATRAVIQISVASDGTPGTSTSTRPAISADGAVITYDSRSSNLVPGDTNGFTDVFSWQRSDPSAADLK